MKATRENPILYIVIPCYNEQEVLPITSKLFLKKITDLVAAGKISDDSRVLFVNDGSKDKTWSIICDLAKSDKHYIGISQSRNRGHQNAVLAGLMEAKDKCDITISIDCDGQDDINAMDAMVDAYVNDGCEVVYGVRSKRDTDTFFKRFTAESFYKLLNAMGAEVVYNHADYRLMSARVLHEFANFKEVNLFLRGMVPLVGFKSTSVAYERHERIAGESHYPLSKMLSLAFDGITSLSVKPIRFITGFGVIVALISFIGVIWAIVEALLGATVSGWASMTSIICFVSGVQLICLGVIGEYIGKIYMETKRRPRYIISMTKAEILRKELYKNGFYIEKELTARENDRNYVIMSVYYDGESREITDAFAYSGKVTDKEYLSLVCRKLRHAGECCSSSDTAKSEKLCKTAQEIENIITTL